ncbi:branched-chain amino acid ABC transporter permease [Lacrimispora sphenoides]|uniref:Branched-chain amino acid transport system permease protein n=1 Tax=Lacrimispora sphenoides JCM 1415 TaxID=1297793 RepID=A0ABY1CBH8_9FIRM|nr:branched-chain amino acid ABC transporter permease [Lacrimispora sphenoides]SET88588.1 branched-chain amino acid transport system permease protein [[Clostridium] sphenoides JCM 1415]SUY52063.1 high-affinity branched-chain amino acid ABC transporter system permease LivM [Lacrimispora sphenoides]
MKINKTSALIAAAAIALAAILPMFISNNYHLNLMIQVLINIIIVVGLNFITGLTGQMNLGTAGIFSMGAYTSSLLATRLGVNPWICLIAAVGMGFLIGMGLGYPSLRVSGVYLALTTIGFSEIVRILMTNLTGLTGGALGVTGIPPFSILGHKFQTNKEIYYLYLVIAVILIFNAYRIVNSKWGRAFLAVKDNPDAVEAGGINIASIKILAFTLASVYATVAGSLYAHYVGFINPSAYNLEYSINYVVMLVIGGIGSVPGNVLGAILVTLVPEFLRFMENYYWLVFSIITLLFVIFMPNGIVSLFKGKKRAAKAGKGAQANGR